MVPLNDLDHLQQIFTKVPNRNPMFGAAGSDVLLAGHPFHQVAAFHALASRSTKNRRDAVDKIFHQQIYFVVLQIEVQFDERTVLAKIFRRDGAQRAVKFVMPHVNEK